LRIKVKPFRTAHAYTIEKRLAIGVLRSKTFILDTCFFLKLEGREASQAGSITGINRFAPIASSFALARLIKIGSFGTRCTDSVLPLCAIRIIDDLIVFNTGTFLLLEP
jgi:hypothetical protein